MAFIYKFLILFSFFIFTESIYAAAVESSTTLEMIETKERSNPLSTARLPRLKRRRSSEPESEISDNVKIAIIGGGYTGIITAILLGQAIPDASIVLIEKERHLLTGASLTPGRLHLGGEYPLDPETAVSCLWGAFLLKQLFGSAVLTDIPAAQYLVAKDTADFDLTLENQKDFYEKNIRDVYRKIYDRFFPTSSHKEDFFGPPEDLLRSLSASELPSSHFSGGVEIKEPGIHPIKMATALKHLLSSFDITIRTDTEVLGVHNVRGWTLNTNKEAVHADIVVNATWQEIYNLDKEALAVPEIRHGRAVSASMSPVSPEYHIFSRALLVIDTSSEEAVLAATPSSSSSSASAASAGTPTFSTLPFENGDLRAYFGLLGSNGGMFCPINQNTALLYWPDLSGSYIAKTRLGGARTLSSPDFLRRMYKAKEEEIIPGEISRQILENLKEKYPQLKDARPLRLVVRETLSHDEDLGKRPPLPVTEIKKGWFSALSTKATFSGITALNAVKQILSYIKAGSSVGNEAKIAKESDVSAEMPTMNNFFSNLSSSVSDKTWILPEEFRFSDRLTGLKESDYIQDAYHRRLPISMAVDYSMRPTLTHVKEAEIFVRSLPKIIDLAGVELTPDEKEIIISYIGLPTSTLHFLNLSYIKLTSVEVANLTTALGSNASLKQIIFRGMGLAGDDFSSILRVLKDKELEFLDISLNPIDTQPSRVKSKNLLDIHQLIVDAPNSLSTLIMERMGLGIKDIRLLSGAMHERGKIRKYSIDVRVDMKDTEPSTVSEDPFHISGRGLTEPERLRLSRQLSLSLESDKALAGESLSP